MRVAGQPFPVTIRAWRPSWALAFAGLVAVSVLGFVLAPWSMQAKSMAVLHGLCAQRPSHSYWFGTTRLPFDARMTGIYGGFIIAVGYLLARGRFRAAGVPPVSVLVVLALSIVAMGIDGVNSTLDDLRLFSLYHPTNALRYITGAATGTTLAVFLWLLVGSILWRPDRALRQPVIRHWGEFLLIAAPIAAFGLLAASGRSVFYDPLAAVLLLSAVIVVFTLTLAFLQVARRRENQVARLSDLAGPAVAALLGAYAILFALGGARYLLEALLRLPPMT